MAVRELKVVIRAQDVYAKVMTRAQRLATSTGKAFEGIGRQMKRGAVVATAAIAGIVTALALLVRSTVEAGDEVQKMSLRLGISAEALSEFKFAANLSGASMGDMEKAIKGLSKRMLDAQFGLETYKRIFRELGVEYETSTGELREAEDVFGDAAEAIGKLESETAKTAFALNLFGRAGTTLLPLMKEGADGMAALREEAHELGIVWSEEDADAAAFFKDEVTRLTSSFEGLTKEFGLMIIKNQVVIKAIELIKNEFIDLRGDIEDNRDEFAEFTKNTIIGFVKGIGAAVEVMRFFHNGWLGIKLVVNAAAIVIADTLRITFEGLRMVLHPLDLIFDGLVKLGTFDANPFDSMEKGLLQFQFSVRDVFKDTVKEIEETNASYDATAKFIDNMVAALDEIPATAEEVKKSFEDAAGEAGGGVAGLTDAQKKLEEQLNKLADANLRLGATKDVLLALDFMAFEQQGATNDQLERFLALRTEQLGKETEIAAQKEALAAKERARTELAGLEDPFAKTDTEGLSEIERIRLEEEEKLLLLEEFQTRRFQLLATGVTDEVELERINAEQKMQFIDRERQFREQTTKAIFSNAISSLQSLFTATGTQSKKMQKLQKAAGIAQAVVSGQVAAVEAWKVGMGVGGPPIAGLFTALSLAKTGALIAGIGGAGGGGEGGGGGGGAVGVGGDRTTPELPGRFDVESERATQNIVINVMNPLSGELAEEAGDAIVQAVNKAGERNVALTIKTTEPSLA